MLMTVPLQMQEPKFPRHWGLELQLLRMDQLPGPKPLHRRGWRVWSILSRGHVQCILDALTAERRDKGARDSILNHLWPATMFVVIHERRVFGVRLRSASPR